jgi:hypothetical protein
MLAHHSNEWVVGFFDYHRSVQTRYGYAMREPFNQAVGSGAERSGRRGFPWLTAALLVFVAYPLSTGPAIKLWEKGLIPLQPLEIMYKPLELMSNSCPPIQHFFEWYICKVWRWEPPIYPG